uniref:Uncharacterized protein n=1 Tax=Anopheles farauti TaxID=69004 RepID=A0A182Q9W6_9DIPT
MGAYGVKAAVLAMLLSMLFSSGSCYMRDYTQKHEVNEMRANQAVRGGGKPAASNSGGMVKWRSYDAEATLSAIGGLENECPAWGEMMRTPTSSTYNRHIRSPAVAYPNITQGSQ